MRAIIGDECGLLKESIPELSRSSSLPSNRSSVNDGITRLGSDSMDRSRGIVGLAFCPEPNNDSLAFCALRADGSVERWEGCTEPPMNPYERSDNSKTGRKNSIPQNVASGEYTRTHIWKNIFRNGVGVGSDMDDPQGKEQDIGKVIGICSSQRYQRSTQDRCVLASCTSMGILSIFTLGQDNMNGNLIQIYKPFGKSTNTNISYTKGNFVNRDITSSIAIDYDGKRVALGGRERETTLIDTMTGNVVWKAKNVPPNPQTLLQQPIWSSAMTFLSPSATAPIHESSDLLVVGTAYKQIRIYDIRESAIAHRRPVLYTPEWDSEKLNIFNHRITCLCQLDAHCIVVGDAAGYVHTLDMRKIHHKANGRCMAASVGRFTGPAGSVRQIVKHEELPIIGCVGLDRMLRTYDTVKRKQLDCVYLRQRLNCMLLCSDRDINQSFGIAEDEKYDQEQYPHDVSDYDASADSEEDVVQDYVFSDDEERTASEPSKSGSKSGSDDESEDSTNSTYSSAQDDSEDSDTEQDTEAVNRIRAPVNKRRKRQ